MITIDKILYMSKPGLCFEHIKNPKITDIQNECVDNFTEYFRGGFSLRLRQLPEKSKNVYVKKRLDAICYRKVTYVKIIRVLSFTTKKCSQTKKTTHHCKTNPFFV